MISKQDEKLCQDIIDFCTFNGCEESRVLLEKGYESQIEIRNHKVEKLMHSQGNGLSVFFLIDEKYGYLSSNNLSFEDLKASLLESIAGTKFLEKDPYRRLPDPSELFTGQDTNLDINDLKYPTLTTEEKLDKLFAVYREMNLEDERIITSSAQLSDVFGATLLMCSNHFKGIQRGTNYNIYTSIAMKDEASRPSAYAYDSKLFWDELETGLGTKAYQNICGKLGQKKIKPGIYTVVVDHKVSSNLLRPILSALNGQNIQQSNSFLLNKKNEPITSPLFTLIDAPETPHQMGARHFDYFGRKAQEFPIIQGGVLKNYYLSTYFARKLGVEATTSSPTILKCPLGQETPSELFERFGTEGQNTLFITDFNGGNCNSATGDFSYGIEGFLIEEGKKTQPMSGMIISGNMLTLWGNLVALGSDPNLKSNILLPSLVFKDCAIN